MEALLSTLLLSLTEIIQRQFPIRLKEAIKGGKRPAFLIGNGLTRLAFDFENRYRHTPSYHAPLTADSVSWSGLVNNFLRSSGVTATYDYLYYLGYTNSEIVELAI